MADWKDERDKSLAESTDAAQFLVGKTIRAVGLWPHDPDCDGENVLRLRFSDGTGVDITGGYGGYTGNSCDEYVEFVTVGPLRS